MSLCFCLLVCNVIAAASAMHVFVRMRGTDYAVDTFTASTVGDVLQELGAQTGLPAYRFEPSHGGVVQSPSALLSDIGICSESLVEVHVLDNRELLDVKYGIPADTKANAYIRILLSILENSYPSQLSTVEALLFVDLVLDMPDIQPVTDPCTHRLAGTLSSLGFETTIFESAFFHCTDSMVTHKIAIRCPQLLADPTLKHRLLLSMFGEYKENIRLDFVQLILSNIESSEYTAIGRETYIRANRKVDGAFIEGKEGKIIVLECIMRHFAFDSVDLCDFEFEHFEQLRRNGMLPLSEFKKRRTLWPCGRSCGWILRKEHRYRNSNKRKWSESETFMDVNVAFQTLKSSTLRLCIGLVEERAPGLHLDRKKSVEIFVKRTFVKRHYEHHGYKYELYITSGRIPLLRRTILLHEYNYPEYNVVFSPVW